MVVENTKNIPNPHMHYGKQELVGVMPVPDFINRQNVYSIKENRLRYEEASRDVYQRLNSPKMTSKKKIKKALKIGLAIALTTCLVIFRKNILSLFKKSPKI
jgi:hypothetical protein